MKPLILAAGVAAWCLAWTAAATTSTGPYLAVERIGRCRIELPPRATDTALAVIRYWGGSSSIKDVIAVAHAEISAELIDRENLIKRIQECKR